MDSVRVVTVKFDAIFRLMPGDSPQGVFAFRVVSVGWAFGAWMDWCVFDLGLELSWLGEGG